MAKSLTKTEKVEAKKLNKHDVAEMMKEYNALKASVERAIKDAGIDKMQEKMEYIRNVVDFLTGKATMDFIDMRAVYTDPVEQYKIPATAAKTLYFADREMFESLSGTVTEFVRFDKFAEL